MISGVVRPGPTGTQQPGQRFTGRVEVGDDRIEPEPALVGRGGVLLVGMGVQRACRRCRSRSRRVRRRRPTPEPAPRPERRRCCAARRRGPSRAPATPSGPTRPDRTGRAGCAARRCRPDSRRHRRASPPDARARHPDRAPSDADGCAPSPPTTPSVRPTRSASSASSNAPRGPPHPCRHRSPSPAAPPVYRSLSKCPPARPTDAFDKPVSPGRRAASRTGPRSHAIATERSGLAERRARVVGIFSTEASVIHLLAPSSSTSRRAGSRRAALPLGGFPGAAPPRAR